MIYRITYLSGGLRVRGYLAFPAGTETTAEGIQEWVRLQCGDDELTAEAVACVLPSAQVLAATARRDWAAEKSGRRNDTLEAGDGAEKTTPKIQVGDARETSRNAENSESRNRCAPQKAEENGAQESAMPPRSHTEDREASFASMNFEEAREFARASDSGAPGSYPVLVYCRGGIGRVGRVRLDWLAEFAAFGYIVMAPCYRGGESGVGHDRFGGADLEDSRIAARLARAIPGADPARIALLGFSRGSINATDAAIEEHASRLVLWGGLSDLAVTYEERIDLRRMLKRVIQGSAYKLPDVYLERSPIHMAQRLNCPVLIMHGTEDAQVDYGHGERMYAELLRLGKSATLNRLEGLGHHMPQETRMRVLAGMFAWLEAPPQSP